MQRPIAIDAEIRSDGANSGEPEPLFLGAFSKLDPRDPAPAISKDLFYPARIQVNGCSLDSSEAIAIIARSPCQNAGNS